MTDTYKDILTLFKNPNNSSLDYLQWEQVITVLRDVGVLGKLYYKLESANALNKVPSIYLKHLTSAKVYANRQAHQLTYEANLIQETLSKVGITPIFLKGACYTILSLPNSLGRVCSDIDVLVAKEEIHTAEECLKSSGWCHKKISAYDEKYYREWSHEIPPLFHINRGTNLDLHHNVVPIISGKSPNIKQLTSATLTTNKLTTLPNEALFLHCAVHLFINEDFTNGYRDTLDLYELAINFDSEVFWTDLYSLAENTNFTNEVFIALKMIHVFFNFDVDKCKIKLYEHKHNNLWNRFLINFIYKQVLKPKHPLVSGSGIANIIAYLYGHCRKMPLTTLVPHILYKLQVSALEKLFGKHHTN